MHCPGSSSASCPAGSPGSRRRCRASRRRCRTCRSSSCRRPTRPATSFGSACQRHRRSGSLLPRADQRCSMTAGGSASSPTLLPRTSTLRSPRQDRRSSSARHTSGCRSGARRSRSPSRTSPPVGCCCAPRTATAGYLGLVNTGAVVTADVGHSRPSVLGLGVADEALDLYLVAGADPKDRLTAYTALTGRPDVPPLWAFGYWMGRGRYHSRDEMLDVVATMREHDVPLDVIHCDPDWLVVDRLNCDFIWNTSRFGDRKAFVEALAADGVQLSLWELPYVDPASPRFEEARDKGYLVRTTAGELAAIQKTPTSDVA